VGNSECLEAFGFNFNGISPYLEQRKKIVSGALGGRRPDDVGSQVGQSYGSARDDGAAGVSDGADYVGRFLRTSGSRTQPKQAGKTKSQAHPPHSFETHQRTSLAIFGQFKLGEIIRKAARLIRWFM